MSTRSGKRTAARRIDSIAPKGTCANVGRLTREILVTHLTNYLAGLTITQGRRAGEPLTVLPWQSRFVRGAFATGIQSAGLSVARGNGKSTLLAGVACAALDGPLAVPRGEVLIVAASYQQGRVCFDHIRSFLADRLADKRTWRVQDTMQVASITHRQTGASVRVLGSDPRRAHGLAPVLVLCDEPAQWPESTGERMVAALRTAAGKQPSCRFVALGTRPAEPTHWFEKMLTGGADFAMSFAAAPGDPPYRKRTWAKAKPEHGAHAGPGSGDPIRGRERKSGSGACRTVRSTPAEFRHVGHRAPERLTARYGLPHGATAKTASLPGAP